MTEAQKKARSEAAKALAAARWAGKTPEERKRATAAARMANKAISPRVRRKIVRAAIAGRKKQAAEARKSKILSPSGD